MLKIRMGPLFFEILLRYPHDDNPSLLHAIAVGMTFRAMVIWLSMQMLGNAKPILANLPVPIWMPNNFSGSTCLWWPAWFSNFLWYISYVLQKGAESAEQTQGAVKALQDLYDVIHHDFLSLDMRSAPNNLCFLSVYQCNIL